MSSPDIRWKQRFQNYDKAVSLVEEALARGPEVLSQLEKEGLMQRFEFTVELAWKTMKDYLEESGSRLETVTPKSVVAAAWQARVIPDGEVWMDMLVHRNLLSHRYDAGAVDVVTLALATRYLSAMRELRQWFLSRAAH